MVAVADDNLLLQNHPHLVLAPPLEHLHGFLERIFAPLKVPALSVMNAGVGAHRLFGGGDAFGCLYVIPNRARKTSSAGMS